MSTGVLVFVEQRGGRPAGSSLQLFTPAARLAAALGGAVEAVVIGHGVGPAAEAAARHGATRVYTVDDPGLALYRAGPWARSLAAVLDQARPRAVLMATTFMGRDLAPRVAVRSRSALVTDCTDVSAEGGVIRARRSLYSGKCVGDFTIAAGRTAVVSVRPNSYSAPPAGASAAAAVTPVAAGLTERDDRSRTLEVVKTGGTIKDVAEAEIVVAGGRSLKSADNFALLEELASVLDGAVGATRAAVDAGYQPHARQIGLTGKTITPRLYIGFGIEGALQHLAGMRGSKVIVAVNTKKEAPIFEVASYGCVADLFTLLPLLTAEFRKLKGAG